MDESLVEARIYNHSEWIRDINHETLKESFREILLKSGFGLLSQMEHHFEPQGYTCIWLLAESHFAIHTFPEESTTYIELSSCNKEMYDQFLIHLEAYKENEQALRY
ncbi:MAG: S-adenosylmethionine decarboxylase [Bacteroidota bacterium]